MKTIINLLIIPFLLLTLSSANAQTMWSRIQKQTNIGDVTLPTSDRYKTYTTGVGTNASTTTADCIALKFEISGSVLTYIRNNRNVHYRLFSLEHRKVSTQGVRSYYDLTLTHDGTNFLFRIYKLNHFLEGRKLNIEYYYQIKDILIPGTATTIQYMYLLLSDCGAILWQDENNSSTTGTKIRTAPLFFGYPSNGYHGGGTNQYGINDYLKFPTNSEYALHVHNNRVDGLVLRKPKENFRTISLQILPDPNGTITNPIRNQRLSGESSSSEETLSIDDSVLFSSSIKLHPNPSNGQFNIDLPMTEPGNVSFEIFNMNGQKVFEQKQVEFFQGSTTHHLDTQNKLTSGVYFLNVTAPNFSQKTKLIIK